VREGETPRERGNLYEMKAEWR